MTSKERVKLAYAHKEADRVPVGEMHIMSPVSSEILVGRLSLEKAAGLSIIWLSAWRKRTAPNLSNGFLQIRWKCLEKAAWIFCAPNWILRMTAASSIKM